jgi:hypothetical protein
MAAIRSRVDPMRTLGPRQRARAMRFYARYDSDKPAMQLDKEPTIMVREPHATMQPPPEDHQLVSQHRVLSVKPQPRLDRRGQDGQRNKEKPDHPDSLGDSIASTRIRFRYAQGPSQTTGTRFAATAAGEMTSMSRGTCQRSVKWIRGGAVVARAPFSTKPPYAVFMTSLHFWT